MQIHHVETTYVDRYVLDPSLGPIKRRELVMKASDIVKVGDVERSPDGTFDVPESLGAFLLSHRDRSGTWHEGPTPFPPEPKAKASSK